MKLEDQLRERIRLKGYSYRTEQSYVAWYRRFVHFHGIRHPKEMGKTEGEAFRSHLASTLQGGYRVLLRARAGQSIERFWPFSFW